MAAKTDEVARTTKLRKRRIALALLGVAGVLVQIGLSAMSAPPWLYFVNAGAFVALIPCVLVWGRRSAKAVFAVIVIGAIGFDAVVMSGVGPFQKQSEFQLKVLVLDVQSSGPDAIVTAQLSVTNTGMSSRVSSYGMTLKKSTGEVVVGERVPFSQRLPIKQPGLWPPVDYPASLAYRADRAIATGDHVIAYDQFRFPGITEREAYANGAVYTVYCTDVFGGRSSVDSESMKGHAPYVEITETFEIPLDSTLTGKSGISAAPKFSAIQVVSASHDPAFDKTIINLDNVAQLVLTADFGDSPPYRTPDRVSLTLPDGPLRTTRDTREPKPGELTIDATFIPGGPAYWFDTKGPTLTHLVTVGERRFRLTLMAAESGPTKVDPGEMVFTYTFGIKEE